MTVPPRLEPNGSRTGIAESIQESAASFEQYLSGAEWASEWMAGFNRRAFNNCMQRAWLNPNDSGIAADLELVACTAAAAHAALLTPGHDSFQAPAPGGRVVEVVRKGGPPKQLEAPVQWRNGVFAAVITRNAAALEMLASIPIPALMRISGARRPAWFEVEARALDALFRGDEEADTVLRAAGETADSDRVDALSKDWVHDVVLPELELGLRALDGEPARFNAAFETALTRHHQYYVDERRVQYHGMLALPALAIACFAQDRGLAVQTESDYAPRWLIEKAEQ
jgi:Immunity protein 49